MQRVYEFMGRRLRIHLGDITRLEVDAIVNSENSDLIMAAPESPSVSGAIRRAEGPWIAEALARLGPIDPGRAVVTPTRALPARWVIHAASVARTETGHRSTIAIIRSAVRASLDLASGLGLASLAFPAFAVRATEVSVRDASQAMVDELLAGLARQTTLRDVVVALLDPESFLEFFEEALRGATRASAPLVLRLEARGDTLCASFPADQPVAHVTPTPGLGRASAAALERVARLRRAADRRLLDARAELAALAGAARALLPPAAVERVEAGDQPLVLRLDAALAPLPFELAWASLEPGSARRTARQLVVEGAAPMGAAASPSGTPTALVVGGDAAALPASAREAGALVDLLWRRASPRLAPVLLAGERATCRRVLDELARADLVHWCGHTAGGPAGPRWSLADGDLSAEALGERPLRARLVVSNSCGPDPAARLPRAFLLAGARNYVGTWWDVDDEPARAFARRLYDGLLLGRTVGEALAAARAELAPSAPLAAAAYVHYGDPLDRLVEAGSEGATA